jgi:hypothetical protein
VNDINWVSGVYVLNHGKARQLSSKDCEGCEGSEWLRREVIEDSQNLGLVDGAVEQDESFPIGSFLFPAEIYAVACQGPRWDRVLCKRCERKELREGRFGLLSCRSTFQNIAWIFIDVPLPTVDFVT